MFLNPFVQDVAAAGAVATGQRWPASATTTSARRTITAPRLLPRTIQLCAHCRHRPAGFWVSRHRGQTVRRLWCLSCCQQLDPGHHRLIPFDG